MTDSEFTEQPIAFALDDGRIIASKVLDDYAIKSEDNTDFKDDIFATKLSEEQIKAIKADDQAASSQLREGKNRYGFYNLMKPPYPPKMLTSLKEMNTYHSACVKTKGNDIGGLGVEVIPIGDNENRDLNEKKLLEEFLRRCYPTPEDLFTRAATDEAEVGWLGIELIRTGNLQTGEPQRLEHIPSHTFRIHKDANRFMQTWDGVDKRWFKLIGDYRSVKDGKDKDIDKDTGDEKDFGSLPGGVDGQWAHELLYDINYSSGTTYYGVPDIIPAIPTAIGDRSAVRYNLDFFINNATLRYAIYIAGAFKDQPIMDNSDPENPKPTGKTVLQKAMEDKFEEVRENPHGNLVFMLPMKGGSDTPDVKIEFVPLDVQVKDSHFRLYRMEARGEVLSAHRMDPFRAGIVDINYGSGGGNTVSNNTRVNYKETTALPPQRRLNALINKFVVWADKPKGFGIKDWAIKLVEINTDDETQEINNDKTIFSMGGLRPIDLIRRYGVKRGIKLTKDIENDPALNAFYVNNAQITGNTNPQNPDQVAKIIEDMAVKFEESGEIELAEIMRGLKNAS